MALYLILELGNYGIKTHQISYIYQQYCFELDPPLSSSQTKQISA